MEETVGENMRHRSYSRLVKGKTFIPRKFRLHLLEPYFKCNACLDIHVHGLYISRLSTTSKQSLVEIMKSEE